MQMILFIQSLIFRVHKYDKFLMERLESLYGPNLATFWKLFLTFTFV